MGTGAVNIALGLTVTDLVAGFKVASSTTKGFTNQFTADFDRIKNAASTPTGAVNKLASSLGLAQKGVNPLISSLGGLGSAGAGIGALTNVLGGFFAVDKIAQFASSIADATGKSEKYFAVLRNGLGSRAGAKDSLNLLTDFAATTPNSLDELTGSFVKFVNRGITPTKQQLTNLGDLAASQGKGFDQLTEAVLDAQSGEFERLKEFGIKAAKSGDSVTLSFKGVTQTIKNTSDEVTKAIFGFGQLGGVAGSMSAVSQTLEGKMSNLGDSFDRLLVALGEGGVGGAFKFAIDAGQGLLNVVTDLVAASPVDSLRKEQAELNGLVGALALAGDNEGVRLSLIQKLNQEYPEFLGKLDSESASTELLTRRLADMNSQYEQKIRIALGQKAIQKATEDLTSSISQQANALRQLSTASGKSLTDLEKLSAAGRIDLARKLAASQPKQDIGMGVFAGGSLSAVATTLEQAGKKQASAQAELNRLLGENTARQVELTKTTVSGYQAQIGQIQEKIKLHKIERTEGLAEIKRLNEQILIAQGKTPPSAPSITKPSTKKTSGGSQVGVSNIGDLAIAKRFAEELTQQIQNAAGKGVDDQIQQLKDIRGYIEDIEAISSKNQKVDILGISEIGGPATQGRVSAIIEQFGKIKANTLGLFANTGIGGFIDSLNLAKPGIDFYKNKLSEIQSTIANFPVLGLPVPQAAIDSLALYTQKVNESARALGAANLAAENQRLSSLPKLGGVQIGGFKLELFNDSANTLEERTKQLGSSITSSIQSAASSSITALGDWVGGMFAGTEKLGNLPVAIGSIFANLAKAMGSSLIAFGTAGLAAKAFVTNPVGAIAAGLALTVLGSTLQATMQKQVSGIKDYAGGGLFTGESIIRVGENARALRGGGEFVAPVSLGADLISARIMKNLTPRFNPDLKRLNQNLRTSNQMVQVNVGGEVVLRGSDLYWAVRNAGETVALLT